MDKNTIISPLIKGFLIAGMLILVIFAFLGLTKIVPKAFTSIGSAFSSLSSTLFSPKETIVLSLSNNSVNTGEALDVSFEHKNKSTIGIYEFKFDCSNNDLSITLIDGENQTDMSCTSTSTVSSNPFKIIPQLKNKDSFVDSYIYVTFYDSEKKTRKAMGKTVFTVHNEDTGNFVQVASSSKITTTSKTQATTTTYQKPVSTQNNIIRKSDLYITTKGAGTVINGVFIPKTSFGSYESPSVRFNIGNIGNTNTGPWQFTAVLPTYPAQIFPSGIQPSLKPGEIIEYTLTLQNLASTGNNIVSINIDPTQSVSELSETNNVAVITLVNSGTGTGLILPPIYNNPNYNYPTNNSDLMLRIISKGYVDRNNGRYYTANSVSENNRVAIRFEIENIGRGETGPFIFTADLSGYLNDKYTSPVQNSFRPGEKRQYTVDFDRVADIGTNTITIKLDTNNNVNETREDNNVLSQDILVY